MKTKLFKILLISIGIIMLLACAKDIEVFTGNIVGKVTDSTTGKVLQSVSVSIKPSGNSQTTGSDGYFEFRDLEPKQYEIQAKKDGYHSNNATVTVVIGQDAKGDIQLTPIEEDGILALSVSSLNFGTEYNTLTFDVKNVGNAGDINWEITGIDADWIKVTPTSGTTAMSKSSAVKVDINREKLLDGNNSTTILVNSDGESLRLTINAEKSSERYLEVYPSALVLGTNSEESFIIMSHNGATTYELWGDGDFDWASFDKVEGTIPAYDSDDINTVELITIYVDRTGLAPGNYEFTLIIRSDLGDYRIPVSMTVEEGANSGSDDLVIPSGLYTYYKFEENFDDSSENLLHGFGMNSPAFVEGVTPESKAVKFSKTNNSSFVVPKPIIDSRDMSISFWGKDFSDGNIFYMISSIQSQPMFTLSMSGGQLKFIVTRHNNGYQYGNEGTFMHPTLTDGKWHHIALTSDFNKTTYATITTTLYVDGQAVDVITEYANPFSEAEVGNNSYGSGVKFVMGGSIKLSNSNTLNGTNMTIDNFRVYDTRRLTGEEVKSIYDAKQ